MPRPTVPLEFRTSDADIAHILFFRSPAKYSDVIEMLLARCVLAEDDAAQLSQGGSVLQNNDTRIKFTGGPIYLQFPNPVQLKFVVENSGERFSCQFSRRTNIAAIRRFLAQFHFLCSESIVQLRMNSEVLDDSDLPESFVRIWDLEILVTLDVPQEIPFHFTYECHGEHIEIFHKYIVYFSEEAIVQHALKKFAEVFGAKATYLKITDDSGNVLSRRDPLVFFRDQALHVFRVRKTLQFQCTRPPLTATINLGNHPRIGKARSELCTLWSLQDPELLRFTFNGREITVEENLAHFESTAANPIHVTILRFYRFQVDDNVLELGFSEDDPVQTAITLIEEFRARQVLEILTTVRSSFRAGMRPLKNTDLLGVSIDGVFIVSFVLNDYEAHVISSNGRLFRFALPAAAVAQDLARSVLAQFPDFYLGVRDRDIVFCTDTAEFRARTPLGEPASPLYCACVQRKMGIDVELPEPLSWVQTFAVNETDRISDLKELVKQETGYSYLVFKQEDGTVVPEDFHLCPLVFRPKPVQLRVSKETKEVAVLIGGITLRLQIYRPLSGTELMDWVRNRFEVQRFGLLVDGRGFDDQTEFVEPSTIEIRVKGFARHRIALFDERLNAGIGPFVLNLGATTIDLIHAAGGLPDDVVQFFSDGRPIFEDPHDVIRDAGVWGDVIHILFTHASAKIPCTFVRPSGTAKVIMLQEDLTIEKVLLLLPEMVMERECKGPFGLRLSDSDLLSPASQLKEFAHPLTLIVVQTVDVVLMRREFETEDPIHVNFPKTGNIDSLEKVLQNRFPGCEIADCHSMVLHPKTMISNIDTQPLFITNASAIRSIQITYLDKTVHPISVDGDGRLQTLIEYISKENGVAVYLESDAGEVSGQLRLRDVPNGLRCRQTDATTLAIECRCVFEGTEMVLSVDPKTTVAGMKQLAANQCQVNEEYITLLVDGNPLRERLAVSELSDEARRRVSVHVRRASVRRLSRRSSTTARVSEMRPSSIDLADIDSLAPPDSDAEEFRIFRARKRSICGKPPNYDALLQRLVADSSVPVPFAKRVLDESRYDYARALDTLLELGIDSD
jgi:hypothetical protein